MKTNAISCKDVTLKDGFWKTRQDINKNVTVDAVYNRFYETGRIGSFACNWRTGDAEDQKPHYFWDSDVAKWIEGVSYILMHEKLPEAEKNIEWLIDGIEKNMTSDGYYNVYFNIFGLSKRFTDRNCHELYCAGHHFEAACAYYNATGKDRYLRLMERFADLIYKVFVEEKSAYFVTPGHPEIELALITLYRTTGNKKYLDLCSFFVEQRGNNEKDIPLFNDPKYAYDVGPMRKAAYAEGHSVRMNYLMSGVCDLAYETGDEELFEACRRVLKNATHKRMYITGGQGSTYIGERYTSDYHLPNKTAYAETCASISLGMLAHRMSLYETNSEYDDIVERTLYNNTLSGVSLEGDSFFYENPLEIRNEDYETEYYDFFWQPHYIPRTRRKVFSCSCCPPNIVRLMASVGGYIYSLGEDTLFIHQYIASECKKDGVSAEISTSFPQNGKITVKAAGVAKVAVRVPYYCKELTANLPYEIKDGYAYFDADKTVELDLNLYARFVYSNTRVYDNVGRAAVMYGPLVYCAETADNATVENFFADASADISVGGDFHGAPTVEISGETQISGEELYSEEPPVRTPATLKMIPYFGFANRGEGEMLTYIPLK
ncbi:MAG: glycoside hydrolase family 127 protein [Clostridia bacterium]|nr:glycoside hydrolase family 127 protein [Clostridia bacterium]